MKSLLKNKVLFNVQCRNKAKHIFEKVLELEPGQKRPEKENNLEAYCPYCNQMVEVTVKEKVPLNEELIKRFEEQDRKLGLKEKKWPAPAA
ncbi:MAG: hypothetical protein JSV88_27775 [Candidatus Aminicenantes bacterium]|nr:MAG: hypothetical protein JSV88_27775 [Candidatus Aminicenantes bacterium]